MDINKLAVEFQKKNRGKGTITKVTDYSFTFTSMPNKDGKTTDVVYYLSYFLEFDKRG